MNLTQPKIALYAALIFGSGALLGGFSYRLYNATAVNAKATVSKGPANFKARYIEESQRRLNLTEAQLSKLVQNLDETRARMDEVNARAQPEIDRIRDEQIDKIRAMLTPTQLLEYEKFRKEREDRRKADEARKKQK